MKTVLKICLIIGVLGLLSCTRDVESQTNGMATKKTIGSIVEFSGQKLTLCGFLGEGKESFVFMAKKDCSRSSSSPHVVKQLKFPSDFRFKLIDNWRQASANIDIARYLNPILDVTHINNKDTFTLSKLVEGQTLDVMIESISEDQKIPLAEALGRFYSGLADRAHEFGYFIFDTAKLDNIMVSMAEDGSFKLLAIDAVVVSEATMLSDFLSVPRFPSQGLEKASAHWGFPALAVLDSRSALDEYLKAYVKGSQLLSILSPNYQEPIIASLKQRFDKWSPSLATDRCYNGLRSMVENTFETVLK